MALTSEAAMHPVMELPSDSIPTSLDHGNPMSITIPQGPPMVPLTTAAILSQRRRRKSTTSMKRSASTPNVRGHHSGDAGMTLAEKRRNKLGYHRTSVACGHCRRRKIRCLAAPDDPQGRCANCIRLKKECNFFPVDQQPPIERRPRAQSGRTSISSDSSPAINGGSVFHPSEPFNFSNVSFNPNPDYPPPTASMSAGGVVSPMTKIPENSHFDFSQQTQRNSWPSPFPDNVSGSAGYSSPGEAPAHVLWGRHSDSPVTPGYSPHVPATSTTMANFDSRGGFTSFAPSRDNSWSAPHRSMSYSMLEGLPPNSFEGSRFYPHSMSREMRRRGSDMRPPSLQTSATSSNTSISETHMTPLSAPIPSPTTTHWTLPNGPWSALPGTTMSKPYDAGYYPDPSPLAKVTEEEYSPHFAGEPAILYAGVEGHS